MLKTIVKQAAQDSSVSEVKRCVINGLGNYSGKIELDKMIELTIDNYPLCCPFVADVLIEENILVFFSNDDRLINRDMRIVKSILNYSPFSFAINIDIKSIDQGEFKVLQKDKLYSPKLFCA